MKVFPWILSAILSFVLMFSTFSGCAGSKTISTVTPPVNIERIFYNNRSSVTVFIQQGNNLVPKNLNVIFGNIHYITDVPKTSHMYYIERDGDYEIHIHDAKDIDPGETGGKGNRRLGVIE